MNTSKWLLMCTMPRSGSTLLGNCLKQLDCFKDILECFEKSLLCQDYGIPWDEREWRDLPESQIISIFEDVYSKSAHEDGTWCPKLFIYELKLFLLYMKVTGQSFDGIKVIWLRRRNKLKQSISWAKAISTGYFEAWTDEEHKDHISKAPGGYDIDVILEDVARLTLSDYAWEHFFLREGIEPLEIYYEDFKDDKDRWVAVVENIMDYCGINEPVPRQAIQNVGLRNLYTSWNADLYNTCLEEIWARHGGEVKC